MESYSRFRDGRQRADSTYTIDEEYSQNTSQYHNHNGIGNHHDRYRADMNSHHVENSENHTPKQIDELGNKFLLSDRINVSTESISIIGKLLFVSKYNYFGWSCSIFCGLNWCALYIKSRLSNFRLWIPRFLIIFLLATSLYSLLLLVQISLVVRSCQMSFWYASNSSTFIDHHYVRLLSLHACIILMYVRVANHGENEGEEG